MREGRVAGNDAAEAKEEGYLVEGVFVGDGASAAEHAGAADVVPIAFGQPCGALACAVAAGRRGDGRDEDVVAEEVFVFYGVGFVLFGPFVVERSADGDACVVSLSGCTIYIRYKGVAELEGFVLEVEVAELPDASLATALA